MSRWYGLLGKASRLCQAVDAIRFRKSRNQRWHAAAIEGPGCSSCSSQRKLLLLELGLALTCCAEVGTGFQPQQLDGRIVLGRTTRRPPEMTLKLLFQINRAPDVDFAGAKAEEIDKRHAPRRIRDDLTRGFNHGILGRGSALAAEHGDSQCVVNQLISYFPFSDLAGRFGVHPPRRPRRVSPLDFARGHSPRLGNKPCSVSSAGIKIRHPRKPCARSPLPYPMVSG